MHHVPSRLPIYFFSFTSQTKCIFSMYFLIHSRSPCFFYPRHSLCLSIYIFVDRRIDDSVGLPVCLAVCLSWQADIAVFMMALYSRITMSQNMRLGCTSSSIFYTTKSQQGEVILPIGASSRITESHEDCLQTMVIQRQGLTQWNQHSSFSTYFLFVQTGSFPPQCFRFVPESSR